MALRALSGDRWTERTARIGFQILVEYAHARRPITYGEWDAEIVRRQLGHHVLLPQYGWAAGAIGRACQEYAKEKGDSVPMMNLLVVNEKTGIPGYGADDFLRKFRSDFLKCKVTPERLSQREKQAIIERAHQEIFNFRHWPDLLNAYGLRPTAGPVPPWRGRRRPDPKKWHFGPESEDNSSPEGGRRG